MTELAAAIADIPIPLSMQALPIDRRGFPVPWFVSWEDGEPDFRVIGRGKIVQAVKQRRCWVCGGKLGRLKVSVMEGGRGRKGKVREELKEDPRFRAGLRR